MKKLDSNYFPPNTTANEGALCAWIDHISKDRPELLRWAKRLVKDKDILAALDELSEAILLPEMLAYLEDLRSDYQVKAEARQYLRLQGTVLKEIRRAAQKALAVTKLDPVDDDYGAAVAKDLKGVTRLRAGFEPKVGRRDTDIAEYKQSLVALLKSRNVINTNEYGWQLLRAAIPEWVGGKGKDQIEAFRKIPDPYYGPIRNRTDALAAVKRAQVGAFRMKKRK